MVILVLMKNNTPLKNLFWGLCTLSLCVLLLVSPCRVRNFIQAETGVSTTKVLNKSQTTVSNSNCSYAQQQTGITKVSKVDIPVAKILFFNTLSYIALGLSPIKVFISFYKKYIFSFGIPLYLVYLQLKIPMPAIVAL